jgi:hypothetical protein
VAALATAAFGARLLLDSPPHSRDEPQSYRRRLLVRFDCLASHPRRKCRRSYLPRHRNAPHKPVFLSQCQCPDERVRARNTNGKRFGKRPRIYKWRSPPRNRERRRFRVNSQHSGTQRPLSPIIRRPRVLMLLWHSD